MSDRIKAIILNNLFLIPLWILSFSSYFTKMNITKIIIIALVSIIMALILSMVTKRFPKYKIIRNEKNRKRILYINIVFVIAVMPAFLFYGIYGWLLVFSVASITQNYLNYTDNN
ncbi:hypothetical protein M2S00_04000 [Apilactobacillus sp. TMW 2.2459]|uniref:hypothetical protein n=1 Tax=Apilactobacillus xinyiensis TaxID=2841032 RepID=UPI001C7DC176|nr:hypothetical protein [Apilactobacillus xinyiensis]MCL0312263.1 hypothetical protein [Apilactobacillus xinyiensis]